MDIIVKKYVPALCAGICFCDDTEDGGAYCHVGESLCDCEILFNGADGGKKAQDAEKNEQVKAQILDTAEYGVHVPFTVSAES